MIDFAEARRMMVDGQVRTADVIDYRLLGALLEVPRERFVPPAKQAIAYLDIDIAVSEASSTGPARCLLKCMVLARMIQAAGIRETDHVLDVGCATGYSSAVLARLADSVVAIEEDSGLAASAARTLGSLGVNNVMLKPAALTGGLRSEGPYDVILLNGSTEIVPEALIRQLKDGGRLVCIQGSGPSGKATLYQMTGGNVTGHAIFDAAAPLLPGFVKPREFVF